MMAELYSNLSEGTIKRVQDINGVQAIAVHLYMNYKQIMCLI